MYRVTYQLKAKQPQSSPIEKSNDLPGLHLSCIVGKLGVCVCVWQREIELQHFIDDHPVPLISNVVPKGHS